MSLRTLLFVFALACRGGGDKESQHQESVPDTAPPEYVDDDGDGYATDEDCDDTDAQIHPDAEEICDNIDQNCDGVLDEGVLHTYYTDADGDGYGDAASEVQSCQTESGTVPNGNDCDDSSGDVYPGAPERCDGLDNDCDDDIDEDDQQTWYTDSDGDGYGDPSTAITTCEAPEDGTLDGSDCDDTDPSASPEGVEICDGIDNDCDGDIDDDLAEDRTTWYEDRDEDGYGDPDLGVLACAQPDGYSDLDTDCDDLAPESFPGADEVCDDADNDCDGSVDEDALDASAWFPDLDHDTYGDPRTVVLSCEAPSGYTDDYSDCDDTDGTEHPAADEICDGDDDDCDGDIDEDDAIDRGTWYSDRDLDGYGDPSTEVAACDAPAGAVDNGLDCDDDDTGENPDAAEICDGDDDDCDGDVDESDAVDASTWHQDRDDDGYGDDARTTTACDAPSG